MTPPIRVNHPNWRVNALKRIARDQQRVRINGWVMLDPEHPDQVGKTRATIWEVHPVMELSIWSGQKWVPLDDLK